MPIRRAKLLELRAALAATVRAAEPWEESYKQDRPTFRRLLAAEQALQNDVAEHYYRLATERLSRFIQWSEVIPRLQADVVVPRSDDAANEEERLLVEVVLPHYEELMLIGLSAGESIYGVPVDL